jgi:DNA polymerase V
MGFPSPAADFIEPPIDLNELIENPISTYYARVAHDPVVVGVHRGDILVIDRVLPLESGTVVLAVVSQQFVLRRLRRTRELYVLIADKGRLPSVEVQREDIWGGVAYVIHKLAPHRRSMPSVAGDSLNGPGGDVQQ